jgi:hypothetical protein
VAYPTGSGSEILRRGAIHNQVATTTSFRFDGTSPTTADSSYAVPANHIITLLNFSVTDMTNASHTWWFWLDISGTEINFNKNVSLNAKQTYVWDDRIVLHPGDKLMITGNSGSNYDIFYSYIDQDWT